MLTECEHMENMKEEGMVIRTYRFEVEAVLSVKGSSREGWRD